MMHVALLAAASLAATQVESADTAELRKEMRRAAIRYETIARRRAPLTFHSGGGSSCDEIVGRFCLTYGDGPGGRLPEEPEVIAAARDSVIRVYRRALTFWPTDTTVVAPLVRYHIEADSMEVAERVAISFERFGGDPLWVGLLRGLANHEAGRSDVALDYFEEASRLMESRERERAWDVDALIARDERRRLEKVGPAERERYLAKLWAYADPLFLTPGNEARAEHFARYVWGRIIRRAPTVFGSFTWGDDTEELLRRFGATRARSRAPGTGLGATDAIIEYHDPDLMTLTPPRLLAEGLPMAPPPPDRWPLDTLVRQSGFAPRTTRSLGPLQHQLSRFPVGDSVRLRVDALLPLDSAAAAAPGPLEAGLFVFDTAFNLIASRTAPGGLRGDTLVLSLEAVVPAATPLIYSVEAREAASRLAARSRYRLDPLQVSLPLVSDLVIGEPFESGADVRAAGIDALGQLVLPKGITVGIFAELGGLSPDESGIRRTNVEFEILDAKEPSVLRRFGRFVGRLFGRSEPGAPRLAWSESFADGEATSIATTIDLRNVSGGLKLLRLTVSDPVAGTRAVRERSVLLR